MGVNSIVGALALSAGILLTTSDMVGAHTAIDCRASMHQIGDLLGLFKLTPSSKPLQAMTVDMLRIGAAADSGPTLGWMFIDQYGNRWIQARYPDRLRFNGSAPNFKAAVRVTGAAQYFPAEVTLSPTEMTLERCDRVAAP